MLDVSPVRWVPRQQSFLEADRSEDRGDKGFTIESDRVRFTRVIWAPVRVERVVPAAVPDTNVGWLL